MVRWSDSMPTEQKKKVPTNPLGFWKSSDDEEDN